MKLRFLAGLLLLVASNLVFSTNSQAQEKVVLYTISEFDAQGREVPLSKPNLQVLNYLESQLNIKFDLRRVPWKRAIENALSDGGILMGMSITQERRKKFAFSEPINGNANWLVTLCNRSFKYDRIEDLQGKTIGIVSSTSVSEEFDQHANKLFQIEHDTGAGIARLKKLALRRVDGLIWYGRIGNAKDIEESINTNYEVKKHETDKPFCVLPKPVSIVTNHFAMKIDASNNQILQRISAALLKGRKEGAIATLNLPN
ncbi:ABC transporter substrate-binding protein [Undibacterium cyanobacteriorum]|uniref:ABC transporter substrate-binding protein n=1 Tax=Undibacterium cyanobacteriorum TaxID=3073561 RepID=A0ABY9RI00_9BURK|nr:ABC transporter substrate-binding protein [Undibacterium sp. 20NA77.5]WMW80494.1 ABC transporter substrate-binding protein [Undibacterium sp. 20NA77.5]